MLSSTTKPAILIQGSEGPVPLISPRHAVKLPIGRGEFACCSLGHVFVDGKGTQHTLPCAREWIGRQTWRLLSKHIERQLELPRGLTLFRLWKAMVPRLMQAIPSDEVTTLPTTMEEFDDFFRLHDSSVRRGKKQTFAQKNSALLGNAGISGGFGSGFGSAFGSFSRDRDSRKTTGITPLVLAVMAGLHEIVSQLIEIDPSQVTAVASIDVPALSVFKGATALHAAVAVCPAHHTEIITSLLQNGADPNASFGSVGIVPAYAAASTLNYAGLEALILCAGETLHVNKPNHLTGGTPLTGADDLLMRKINIDHLSTSRMRRCCQYELA